MNPMKIVLPVLAFVIFSCGCSQQQPPPPPPPAPQFLEHQVKFPGETLSLLASWYTGNSSNWPAIETANPAVNPRRIRPGTILVIPSELVTRSAPLPASVVAKSIRKSAPAPVVQEETPAAADKPLGTEESVLEAPAAEAVEAAAQPSMETARALEAEQQAVPAPASGDSKGEEQLPAVLDGAAVPRAAVEEDSFNAAVAEVVSASQMANVNVGEKADPEALSKELADAVLMNELVKVQLLLGKGADANTKTGGRPILTWAAQNGETQVVALLLASKADVNARDGIGQTALMRAAAMGHKEVVVQLLSARADVGATDSNGGTASTIAEENGYPEIVQIISAFPR